ncbi:MAG: hypothetical protein V1875_10020 [Candidatus Altiarchaeota archaeon]
MALKRIPARQVSADHRLLDQLEDNRVYSDSINVGGADVRFLGVLHGTSKNNMGNNTEKAVDYIARANDGLLFVESSVLETSGLFRKHMARIVPIDRVDSIFSLTFDETRTVKRLPTYRRLDPDEIVQRVNKLPFDPAEGGVAVVEGRYPSRRYGKSATLAREWESINAENKARLSSNGRRQLDDEDFFQGIKLDDRGRSLLMAAEVLCGLEEKNPTEALVVQGMYHMSDTMHFIECPEVAVRYIDLMQRGFERIIGDEIPESSKPSFYADKDDFEKEDYKRRVVGFLKDLEKARAAFERRIKDTP